MAVAATRHQTPSQYRPAPQRCRQSGGRPSKVPRGVPPLPVLSPAGRLRRRGPSSKRQPCFQHTRHRQPASTDADATGFLLKALNSLTTGKSQSRLKLDCASETNLPCPIQARLCYNECVTILLAMKYHSSSENTGKPANRALNRLLSPCRTKASQKLRLGQMEFSSVSIARLFKSPGWAKGGFPAFPSTSQVPWREIRNRADRFSGKWQSRLDEEGGRFLEISHAQTFCNEFFEIFGQNRINVAFYEKVLNRKRPDCFWPGLLLIEWKKPGENLKKAWDDIKTKYIPNLSEDEHPRYYMVGDFKTFWLYDRDKNTMKQFPLSELSKNVKMFDFMVNFNITKRLESKRVRDKDGTPMPGPIIRSIRKNALWLLLVSWTIGLACGLNLSFIIRANRTSKVSSNQAPMTKGVPRKIEQLDLAGCCLTMRKSVLERNCPGQHILVGEEAAIFRGALKW